MKMRKKLERFVEVETADEMNGFGHDFVEKTKNGFWSSSPDMEVVL